MKRIIYLILPFALLLSCKQYDTVQKRIEKAHQQDSIQVVSLDGKTYRGKALIPKLSSKLIVLTTAAQNEVSIPSAQVDYLLAWHKDNGIATAHRFIYTDVEEYESLDLNNQTLQTKESPRWLLEVCTVDQMTMYMEYQMYDIKKEGNIHGSSTGVVSKPPNVWYYLKKEDQSSPIRIALDASAGAVADKYFKSMGQKYFSDCQPVVDKIRSGKLGTQSIEEAMIEYSRLK